MSRKIGRVGRVGRGYYKDPRNDVARVGIVEFGERHNTRGQTGSTTPQQTAGRPSGKRMAS